MHACVPSCRHADAVLKRVEGRDQNQGWDQQHGTLTHRLIASFLEDPLSSSSPSHPHPPPPPPPPPLPPAGLALPTDALQAESLEERIQEELVALGLLEEAEKVHMYIHTVGVRKK